MGCKRIKKLEIAIAGLREQVRAVALSEQKAVESTAGAEARAMAAESSERELRKAVEAIKYDFEVRQEHNMCLNRGGTTFGSSGSHHGDNIMQNGF